VLIIGDFTATVGDPTRRSLTRDEVMENATTYTEQAFKILDQDRTEEKAFPRTAPSAP
jgi:tyrosyl-tRNA synthetase